MSQNDGKSTTKLDRLFTRAVALAAIIGIPAGLYGYFSSQHDKRVETAFAFYKSLKGDRIQKDWALLANRWNVKEDEVNKLLAQNDQKGLRRLTVGLVSDEQSRTAVEEIGSLFDEVSGCVQSGLCDHNTVYAMLKDPADQFVSMYGYYIIHIREGYKNEKYGSGLFRIRAMEKKFNPFEYL
jgi:hypothetical protein